MGLRYMLRQLLLNMPVWSLIAVLGCALVPGHLLADSVLSEATVRVDNRDRPARQEGFERALGRVLVKLSGDRAVLRDARTDDLRGQAARYVQRFRYVDAGDGAIGLEVRFDGAVLERLLAERGLPVWGATRPTVLVWLAAMHQGDRVIAGGGEAPALLETLERVAAERGIDLVFPVMDLEDRMAVDYADLAGGFPEPILSASERYSARYVTAAHLQPRGRGWGMRWRLLSQDFSEDFAVERDSPEEALEEGLQELADRLGRRLAIAGLLPTEDHVQVMVEGVDSLADYQRVQEYLSSLSVVVNLKPWRLEPERAVFVTQLRGSPRDLERGVRLGQVLEPAESAEALPDAGAMPRVHLRLYR